MTEIKYLSTRGQESNLNFEDVVFENIVFDMTKFQELEIRLN